MSNSEIRRLQELQRYAILDSEPEEAFDRITRLTKNLLNAPIALISLVDEDRQWFKSHQGLQMCETSKDGSFCAYAIETAQPFIIEDTLLDDRFKNSEMVLGETNIRFYAGIQLISPSGLCLGVLCIMDHVPRKLSENQLSDLYDMSRIVIDEIELRSLATIDCLTGLQQRQGFWIKARQELDHAKRFATDLSVILLDIDRFKVVNDTYGHPAGDRVLQNLADVCRKNLRVYDIAARFGGEEFAFLLPKTNIDEAFDVAERLRTQIATTPAIYRDLPIYITTSFGVSSVKANRVMSVTELVHVADKCLYEAKNKGRNRTICTAA
nr:sensor domain-containing diguanylate cyclase [uncultured Cohaesibacter sp.]